MKDKTPLTRQELEQYYISPVLYIITVGVLCYIIASVFESPYIFPLIAIMISLIYISQTHHSLKDGGRFDD